MFRNQTKQPKSAVIVTSRDVVCQTKDLVLKKEVWKCRVEILIVQSGQCGNSIPTLLYPCQSVPCLQIVDYHNFTHFFAVSLKIRKSSRDQGVLSSGQCSKCSIVCVCVLQLPEGSSVWYPHLIKFALVRPTPDLSQLSVFYAGQGGLLPGGRLSDG